MTHWIITEEQDLGPTLRLIMKSRGVKGIDLTEFMTEQTVGNLLSGKTLNIKNVIKILDHCGMKMAFMITAREDDITRILDAKKYVRELEKRKKKK